MLTIIPLFLVHLLLISTTSQLYQIVSLSRHGARYHVMDFYDGKDTLSKRGHLTPVGERQNQKLGQLWRKQYIDQLGFLSNNYNKSQIEVISTPYNRTINSASSLFYGLYPIFTGQKLTSVDQQFHLPPFSNNTDDKQQNYALPNGHSIISVQINQKIMIVDCPNFDKFAQINFQRISDIVRAMNVIYYPFIKRMSEIFNFTVDNQSLLSLTRCYDAISVDMYLGRPIPPQFTEDDYKNLKHITNWYFYIEVQNQNNLLINTLKFQKILKMFDSKIKSSQTNTIKWTMLLGHDTDILAMHQALNISSAACTEELYQRGSTSAIQCEQGGVLYAANIILQLHSDDSTNFYIKVKSNGKYMKICGKSNYQCSYQQFKDLVKHSMADRNMDDICGKHIIDAYQTHNTQNRVQRYQNVLYNIKNYQEHEKFNGPFNKWL